MTFDFGLPIVGLGGSVTGGLTAGPFGPRSRPGPLPALLRNPAPPL